jgi:hypothetical protein
MADKDLSRRLREAFARLNERIDSAEDKVLTRESTEPAMLASELAQARSMLDVVATRLSAIPAGERADLDRELRQIRRRWDAAHEAYEAAKASTGGVRAAHEQASRAGLDEVQDGLLRFISQMNTRFAGHPPGATP